MGSAPASRQGIAAGMLATARNAGMVLGVGLSGAVLTTVMAQDAGRTVIGAVARGFTWRRSPRSSARRHRWFAAEEERHNCRNAAKMLLGLQLMAKGCNEIFSANPPSPSGTTSVVAPRGRGDFWNKLN